LNNGGVREREICLNDRVLWRRGACLNGGRGIIKMTCGIREREVLF
jgi:hypothetical protein